MDEAATINAIARTADGFVVIGSPGLDQITASDGTAVELKVGHTVFTQHQRYRVAALAHLHDPGGTSARYSQWHLVRTSEVGPR